MSNFKSAKLVNPKNSIVLTFTLGSGVQQYHFGFRDHKLKVSRNTLKWSYNGEASHQKFSNKTLVTNLNNYFLGNEIIFKHDANYNMDNKYIHTTNDGIHTFITNTKEVSFNDLDLGYKCYITSQDFINQDLKQYPIFQNNTYYFESTLEVVPIVHINKNDDDDMDTVILVGLNSSECSILAYDYGIAIDPSENKITSIQAIHNNKVIDTTYINNLQYDKARFVISDYGRLISHSVHKKDSDKMFEQPNITVFNTVEKSSTPTRVHFYTNNDKGITDITSNF